MYTLTNSEGNAYWKIINSLVRKNRIIFITQVFFFLS